MLSAALRRSSSSFARRLRMVFESWFLASGVNGMMSLVRGVRIAANRRCDEMANGWDQAGRSELDAHARLSGPRSSLRCVSSAQTKSSTSRSL